MAKGAGSKQQVMATILQTFPSSFLYNDGKEIRINMNEGGEAVQIKVTLTAAKAIVEPDSENAVPGAAAPTISTMIIKEGAEPVFGAASNPSDTPKVQVTDDEAANLRTLMEELGL